MAEQVQFAALERGEPGDVLLAEFVALSLEPGDDGVDMKKPYLNP